MLFQVIQAVKLSISILSKYNFNILSVSPIILREVSECFECIYKVHVHLIFFCILWCNDTVYILTVFLRWRICSIFYRMERVKVYSVVEFSESHGISRVPTNWIAFRDGIIVCFWPNNNPSACIAKGLSVDKMKGRYHPIHIHKSARKFVSIWLLITLFVDDAPGLIKIMIF